MPRGKPSFGIKVQGAKEVSEAFLALDRKVQKGILSPAMKVVAKKILADAKARVPVDTGRLRKGLKVKVKPRSRRYFGWLVIPPRRGDLSIDPNSKWYYPTVVEYGGTIKTRTTKKSGKINLRKPIKIPAHPYMRPAFDSNKDWGVRLIMAELDRGVKQAMATGGKSLSKTPAETEA